ncbi:transporter substrate-binding domain-containing protein [Shimia sp. R11_0]|uniref:substrate-binding periplasmic protein n=1 Tax=Shimia sp. R11_0 TaxID=2821096 RepID=UPI001ADC1B13|nr:transporter substrate-binding domain-containing protein [Shimia sp. R11_0]MBO9479170.1 transporter substrate-binding domain-containing protein [Shimia sp. R11_0]
MTFMKRAMTVAALSVGLAFGAQASEHQVMSLEWAPYVGSDLPEGGILVSVLEKALAKSGHSLSVEYLPWARSQKKAADDPSVLGYYPAWPSEVQEGFFASPVIYSSPVGFVQRQDNPINWTTLEDLHGLTVVVVRSYEYPEEFEALMASGAIAVQEASDDAQLLKMVAGGRGDIGVIDRFVMAEMLTTPEMAKVKDKVAYNERNLVEYPLVLAMRDTPENQALAVALDSALQQMPVDEMVRQAFEN